MSRKSAPEMRNSVRDIFTAALRMSDPAQLTSFLEAECGTDVELRVRVEDLLGEATLVDDFLERPAVSEATASERWSPGKTLPPGESPGDQIGPYRLVELVGEGGGGSVYRAEQISPVRRMVALKILKLGMDTRSVISRFDSERQALAVMDHPNIARVLDAGASPDGRPYFVMDFVKGEPITDYCNANSLTARERVVIFVKVCRAVEHAHQKGIIHRDLKPSNILVTDQDGQAEPKVIDFGVAKAIDPLEGENAVTMMESIIGTPAYMSPEQAERGRVDVDTRSDVYSLGVLLYELLTSYTPHDRGALAKAELDELRATLRGSDPERPSQKLRRGPREDRPGISIDRGTPFEKLASELSGDLDWIVMKCLERDRARRYGSASELTADLERYLQGSPVTARPPTSAYRLGKFVRKHRTAVGASALILLLLIAGATISTVLALRATRAERDIRKAHRLQSQLRDEAVRDRELALQSAATARLHEYVADINVSHHALLDGHIAKALSLLERQEQGAVRTDLLGFEWRYLMGRCSDDSDQTLPRLDGPVTALAYSPEGDRLAVGTRLALLVWDLRLGRPLLSVPESAFSIAFFPDGERLAASSRQEMRVYDLATGDILLEEKNHGGSLALSPDGGLLAASDRGGVTIWETASWSTRSLPRCHGPLTFSPDGATLATGSPEGIVLWSMGTGNERVVLDESATPLSGMFPGGQRIVFSPDGTRVIAPHTERSTRGVYYLGVWDAKSGHEAGVFAGLPGDEGHSGMISAVGIGGKSAIVATSSWDHSVRLWDSKDQRLIRPLYGHRGEVWSIAVAPDGESVASGSKDGDVKIWSTKPSPTKLSIAGRWKPLSFSKDSNYFGALNFEGAVSIFNPRSGEAVHSIDLTPTDVRFRRDAVSLARDLTVLAEGLPDGTVKVRRLDRESEMVLRVGDQRVDSVALSPNAEELVTVSRRDDLAWWDLKDPTQPIAKLPAMYAVFSDDGGTLAAVTREGIAIVWDTASRQERIRIAHGGQSFGSRAALSPDGKLIALTHGFEDFENVISLWDTATGKQLGTMTGHKQAIWSVAFSPDGRTLATSSNDGTLRLWNVASRRELLAIDEHGGDLTELLFSPDGHYLIGGSPSFVASGELRIIPGLEKSFGSK